MIKLTKKKIVVGVIIILAVGLISQAIFGRDTKPLFEVIEAKRADLTYEVSVTGKVEPSESIDLAFEKSGKVAAVYARVGDKVAAGKILASLNNSELAAQLKQSQAALAQARAKLAELERGTRAEDLAVKQAELDKAQSDLESDYDDALTVLLAAFNDADEAVRVNFYDLFSVTGPTTYDLTYLCDSSVEYPAVSKREDSEIKLNQWNSELKSLNLSTGNLQLEQAVTQAKLYVVGFLSLSNAVGATLNTGSTCSLNASLQETYRANHNLAQANLLAAQTSLNSWQQTIAAGKLTVQKITSELALKTAGTPSEQIEAQKAAVVAAEANVLQYSSQISKGLIVAPISGTVTEQGAKVGQIVSANTILISLISDNQYEIEAFVPEADIAHIKIGNTAYTTLDAYSSDVQFGAKVVTINPAETVIDSVSTYKVTLAFDETDDRIKSGMTANLDILAELRLDVIVVPQRAVYTRDGSKFLKILKPDKVTAEEVPVKVGLRGSDGNIEILEGIEAGAEVVISVKD